MADNNKYPPNHQEHLKEWFNKESKIPLKERYKDYPKHIDVESIIKPLKKKYTRGMCVVCLKTLENQIQIKNMMCDNCEESTSKIADEFTEADNKKRELGKEAMALMVELLPSEEYGENFDCERLQNIICELSGYDFSD